MAASIAMMPNPNNNHFSTFPGDALWPNHPCSFGQLTLMNKRKSTKNTLHAKAAQALAASVTAPRPAIACKVAETNSGTDYLASVWREVHGSDNWENLVEPLDPLLRDEIIRYGEFVAACYRAFDLDPSSKRYLRCKYGKRNMLTEVGMGDCGYQVTKYIYATPDISNALPIQRPQQQMGCGRWVGYIAVSSDEEVKRLGRRDLLVTFRGTVTNPEWISNLMSSLTPARLDPRNPRPRVMVESGFLNLYTSDESAAKFGVGSCREQLLSEVSRLLNKYKGEEMSITLAGHSMGSSLALLLAYDIAELGLNRDKGGPNQLEKVPVTVFSFAGPRVGNMDFKERCEELGVKVLRIVNVNDPITKLPGVFLNENFRVWGDRYGLPWSCSCYAHVGVELALDFFKMGNPSCVHDLETYISLLKCPREGLRHIQREGLGDDFFSRAKELLLNVRNFEGLPWRNGESPISVNGMFLDNVSSQLLSLLYIFLIGGAV